MSNQARVQPISSALLTKVLSNVRLEAYRLASTDTTRMLLGRYRWNVALCMALYPLLGCLEVALRNHLHEAVARYIGTPRWYEDPSLLKVSEQGQVAQARKKLLERKRPVEPNRMVAELNFGFWTGLLRREYEQILWPRLLAAAFPSIPRKLRTRHFVADRMHALRKLRNRVFHHEPIWGLSDLPRRHAELRETLMWFDPALPALLPSQHTFEEIHAQGSLFYEQDVSDGDLQPHDEYPGLPAFSGRPLHPLRAIVEALFVGLPVSRHQARKGERAMLEPILSVGDIDAGRIAPREALAPVALRSGDFERFRIQTDDVLLSCRGTVLKVARVPHSAASLLASSNLIVVRPGERLHPAFLLAVLRSHIWQDMLRKRSRSSSSLVQLTARDVADLPVPVPALHAQSEIAALVEAEEDHYRSAIEAAERRRALVMKLVEELLPTPEDMEVGHGR